MAPPSATCQKKWPPLKISGHPLPVNNERSLSNRILFMEWILTKSENSLLIYKSNWTLISQHSQPTNQSMKSDGTIWIYIIVKVCQLSNSILKWDLSITRSLATSCRDNLTFEFRTKYVTKKLRSNHTTWYAWSNLSYMRATKYALLQHISSK